MKANITTMPTIRAISALRDSVLTSNTNAISVPRIPVAWSHLRFLAKNKSERNINVNFNGSPEDAGKFVAVRITGAGSNTLRGQKEE